LPFRGRSKTFDVKKTGLKYRGEEMSLIVQKFGGTSVADLERIRHVAKRVVATYDQGNDVAVVLSAMSGITDNLIDMAREVTEAPDGRELDVLLATGEQTTSALLAMMLKSMNYPAQSLLGHQAEVVTDYCHGKILQRWGEAGLTRPPWPLQRHSKRISVKYIRMWMEFIQPIPISVKKPESFLPYPMTKC
jgi:hypothetical protein